MNLQMVLKNDQAIVEEDLDLFKLKAIKNEKQLSNVDEVDVGTLDPAQPLEDDTEDLDHRKKRVAYKKNARNEDWYAEEGDANDEDDDSDDDEHQELEFESDAEEDAKDDEDEEDNVPQDDENPLLVDVAYGSLKNKRKEMGKLWFEKEAFADMDDEEELLELEMMSEGKEKSAEKRSKSSEGKQKASESKKGQKKVTFADAVQVDATDKSTTTSTGGSLKTKSTTKTSGEPPKKKQKRVKLDPEGLAIGTMMIKSRKAKRDIIDAGFNRYTFNDDNLPKWFVEEEKKHSKKMMPETAEMVAEYKAQLKAVNARPIKKVAEAKARKKLRAARKLEKARKRAETITEKLDMTDAEKAQQIRAIYKKVLRKKDDKGKFKVVDPRMKKDLRKKKAEMKKKR
ncbi:hypothetical protein MRX96_016467 [Rhipicephalus microplus]